MRSMAISAFGLLVIVPTLLTAHVTAKALPAVPTCTTDCLNTSQLTYPPAVTQGIIDGTSEDNSVDLSGPKSSPVYMRTGTTTSTTPYASSTATASITVVSSSVSSLPAVSFAADTSSTSFTPQAVSTSISFPFTSSTPGTTDRITNADSLHPSSAVNSPLSSRDQWSGVDNSTKIAIGVGVAGGVVAFTCMGIAFCFARQWCKIAHGDRRESACPIVKEEEGGTTPATSGAETCVGSLRPQRVGEERHHERMDIVYEVYEVDGTGRCAEMDVNVCCEMDGGGISVEMGKGVEEFDDLGLCDAWALAKMTASVSIDEV